MVILTILAWATQTLVHQWGYGAEPMLLAEPAEKFVPADRAIPAGTLEIRAEATILGNEVRLKQIGRWSSADKAAFEPLGEMVLVRLPAGKSIQAVTLDQVKSTLHDAGVNLALINFAGPTACTVSRSDASVGQGSALEQWVAAKEAAAGKPQDGMPQANRAAAAGVPAPQPATQPSPTDEKLFHTLRDVLVDDLAQHLCVPVESLSVQFSAKDEKVLRLVEPHFRFAVESRYGRNLGDVGWEVSIMAAGGSQRASISAFAKAWQNQLVTVKPLAARQVFRAEDVIARRVLVDQLNDQTLLTAEQVVGQQAARDLGAGTVVVGRLVEAVPLVQPGQLVTIIAEQGRVQVKTVAEARQGGSFGQIIQVRNPATRDEFAVQITGPQAGKVVGGAGPVGTNTRLMSIQP